MLRVQSPPRPEPTSVSLAASVHRDLEVGRYDHVPQGASWLRDLALEAAQVADVPAAAVSLMKSRTQRIVAAVGLEVGMHARSDTLCSVVVDGGQRVHVADVSQDARWSDNPFVDGRWGRVRFYGAHPLVNPSGFVVGTLCVFDMQPRELDAEQVAVLDDIAARAVGLLEQSRLESLQTGVGRWKVSVAP